MQFSATLHVFAASRRPMFLSADMKKGAILRVRKLIDSTSSGKPSH
jgi:hypothetical protein